MAFHNFDLDIFYFLYFFNRSFKIEPPRLDYDCYSSLMNILLNELQLIVEMTAPSQLRPRKGVTSPAAKGVTSPAAKRVTSPALKAILQSPALKPKRQVLP